MRHFVLLLLFFSTTVLQAQELERDLMYGADKHEQYLKYQSRLRAHETERGSGSIPLPFFDDFSTFSQPTDDPDIPDELQRWSDFSAYINCHYPIEPPTVGVATLDGLDFQGYPYQFVADSYGSADTLTSVEIDLSGYSPEDEVYLTFFYQGGGRGNAPDEQDSLVVEFYAPIGGEDPWFHAWSIPGAETEGFQQVFIPIDDNLFLEDGFRFRFRNYATLSGNLDHWHVDYVFIDENIDPADFDFFEVAFVDCPNTLLADYTSMPWTHFQSNPPQFMRQEIATLQGNLSNTQADNVTSGFKVEYEGNVENFQNDFSIVVVAPNSTFTTDYAINSAPNNFVFDDTVSDTTATFNVSFYEDNIGILTDEKVGVPDNDSLVFQQVFQNYYAYDDGSAERAYALNVPGGRVAMKYQIAVPDTLYGIFIHFTPLQNNNNLENFLLRLYNDEGGVPGDEIIQNFQFYNPVYFTEGRDVFAYYEFDDPVEVDGTIYVGFVQDSEVEMNIGLDKNTNANPSRLFYQLGIGADWQQSSITGSVMIRPVFRAGMTGLWNGIEEAQELNWSVYPNPTTGVLNVELKTALQSGSRLLLRDMQGRRVDEVFFSGRNARMDLSALPAGLYIVQCVDADGRILGQEKLLKQ
jgi:hypothetical protein